jgi:ABC-type uncharacterized transport system involved in gliding motility auxiliary subunit
MKKYLQKLDTLGLLFLVAGVIWYSVSNTWGKWDLGFVIAGALMVITGIAANYRQILASLGKRSTKYASNYVVSLILVIAVVSGLNYLGQRHPKRFDTTSGGQYSLAPQTIQVLEKLAGDVDIKAFYPGGDDARVEELLVEYKTISKRIRYKFIDPDKQPDVAKQYGVSSYGTAQNPFSGNTIKFGTIVVSYQNRKEKIEKRSEEVQEEDLTNAIIKVGRSEAKKIYFVQGHGEKDPSDTDQKGYSETQRAMESQGYSVGIVNLAGEGKVPADAKVLIIAGPTSEPFPQELQLINDFLNKGSGGLFLLLDPAPAPSLDTFLKAWGVQVDKDVILDVSGAGRLMGTGPAYPLVLRYENHKITERFNTMTFFPFTRSIQPEKSVPEGLTVEPLFKSSENSWGETNLNDPKVSFNEDKDIKGPLPLAVAVTKEIKPSSDKSPKAKARIVVTGTSNFPINAYFPQQGNGNLFLNMVSWLAQDEDLISIRPKQSDDRRIMLSQSQLSSVKLLAVYLLPGIALFVGIIVVMKRRRR